MHGGRVAGPRVKVGLVQTRAGKDYDRNIAIASGLVEEAAEKGATIVCLPELFYSRYFPQKPHARVEAEPIPGPTSRALGRIAKENGVVLVGGSIFEARGDARYNTCVVFAGDGRTLGKYSKVHIPYDSHYYERNYFTPGAGYSVARTSVGRVGTLICYDQWFPEPARINKLKGAEILFYPTSIAWVRGIKPVEGNWKEAWEAVQRGHAISNTMVVCAVNRVGVEGDMKFWGGSFVYDQFGNLLMRASNKEGAFVVEVDLGLAKEVEKGWGFRKARSPKTYSLIAKQ